MGSRKSSSFLGWTGTFPGPEGHVLFSLFLLGWTDWGPVQRLVRSEVSRVKNTTRRVDGFEGGMVRGYLRFIFRVPTPT